MGTVSRPARAVVFAYHNVGVRCLKVLLDAGVQVALVVTHEDSPNENIWFESVHGLARSEQLPVITPANCNDDAVLARVAAAAPDFIFSFYYRQMMGAALLRLAPRGALNMHGSLLPRYRGRAPVNWAVLHGETRTGASLHYMVEKPDAGDLVAQTEVPILGNDTAGEVFDKVSLAAELTLHRVLPDLLADRAPRLAMNLAAGSYFGGRKPEDGCIDWRLGPQAVHNLVRAVAPPYPGAWFELNGKRFEVHETRLIEGDVRSMAPAGPEGPVLQFEPERVMVGWSDPGQPVLWLRRIVHGTTPLSPQSLRDLLSLPTAHSQFSLDAH